MNGKNHVLVTSFGTDRPGIVEDLSRWILQQGGNIEDSRMSLLGGEFATLILVSGGTEIPQKLENTRAQFESQAHLTVITKPVSGAPVGVAGPMLRYDLRATSLDHPGIVHEVASLLRQHAINIVSASTGTSPAPFTGIPVFHFEMTVDLPSTLPVKTLREELDKLGERERIDFMLAPRT